MRFGRCGYNYQTPTIDTAAFSAGDNVGGRNLIDGLGPFGTGVLKHVTITDFDNQKAALTIVFFDTLPAGTFTNNAAFPSLVAADLARVIGKVEVAASDYTTINGRAVATVATSIVLWGAQPTPAPDGASGSDKRSLYYAIQTSGTPTYTTTSSLGVQLGFLLD
jgi:hypothetical protein